MRGIFEIVAAIRLRKEIEGEWLMALAGALSIAFGALMFAFPGSGAVAVVWWIGAYAVAIGPDARGARVPRPRDGAPRGLRTAAIRGDLLEEPEQAEQEDEEGGAGHGDHVDHDARRRHPEAPAAQPPRAEPMIPTRMLAIIPI